MTMSSHDALPPDDFDELLLPRQTPVQNGFRDAVLQQTMRVVRRRRRARKAFLVGAMLACYVAGAMTVQFWSHRGEDRSLPVAHQATPLEPTAVPAGIPSRRAEVAKNHPPAPPLLAYERLRRYSDRLLEQDGDITRAARYYARALDQASAEERAISVGDTWLLMALKADRFPEKNHENHGS